MRGNGSGNEDDPSPFSENVFLRDFPTKHEARVLCIHSIQIVLVCILLANEDKGAVAWVTVATPYSKCLYTSKKILIISENKIITI